MATPDFCCGFIDPEMGTEECEPAHTLKNEIGYNKPETVRRMLEKCITMQQSGKCKRPEKLIEGIDAGVKFLQQPQ